MEPDVDVMTFLLARQVMTDAAWRTPSAQPLALHGVSYAYQVEPDTEFPKDARPPWALFLRATGREAGPVRVLFRVHHRDGRGQWRELSRFPAGKTIDFPDADDDTRDVKYDLPYLRMGGIGLHAVSISFRAIHSEEPDTFEQDAPAWSTDPEELFGVQGWRFGAVAYFWVERPS